MRMAWGRPSTFPDGKRLLSSSVVWANSRPSGPVLEWDIESGQLIRTIAKVNAMSAQYSHDGTRIFLGEGNGLVRALDSYRQRNLALQTAHFRGSFTL